MRKDVAKLSQCYPPLDSKVATALERLGWPTAPRDLAARYATLLSAIDFDRYSLQRPLKLLDVGCGLGLLLDYLKENKLIESVDYTGLDLLEYHLRDARRRWPEARFELRDIRDQPYPEGAFDYCILCGIFTTKQGNTYADTVAFAQSTLKAAWASVTVGLGFNAMSKHVDWERDDLFHWPLDEIMAFCKRDLSRHVSFQLDYGLWEASTLVRKAPRTDAGAAPMVW